LVPVSGIGDSVESGTLGKERKGVSLSSIGEGEGEIGETCGVEMRGEMCG
jgi:hypothetical protein